MSNDFGRCKLSCALTLLLLLSTVGCGSSNLSVSEAQSILDERCPSSDEGAGLKVVGVRREGDASLARVELLGFPKAEIKEFQVVFHRYDTGWLPDEVRGVLLTENVSELPFSLLCETVKGGPVR